MSKHPIKEEWMDYYQTLEDIRQSGICNMFGASPYLAEIADIDEDLATEVLLSWMENYGELNERFGWQ